jgi:hypothetical protein
MPISTEEERRMVENGPRLTRLPSQLPDPDDWLVMGYVYADAAGTTLLNVRQIIRMKPMEPDEPGTGMRGVTGAVDTRQGVRWISRPWESFLADVVLATNHVLQSRMR